MAKGYKSRSVFYFRSPVPSHALGAPKMLHGPSLGNESNPSFAADETINLKDREHLDTFEALRHTRERDYYQDHTYHDQWEQRDLENRHKTSLSGRFPYFASTFQIKPWVWYPGDLVEVVVGPQTGQRGAIIAVVPYKNELLVQNINVKDVSIPATDTRPEQVVQREHPIRCTTVQHVDPTTSETCTLSIIRVRAKTAEGAAKTDADGNDAYEETRISLESGTLLAIPPRDEGAQAGGGDPLHDTPYLDALIGTYREEEEIPVLVERKLAVLEKSFVESLARSYKFHADLQQANGAQLADFQRDALSRAVDNVAKGLNDRAEELDEWWFERLAPHITTLEAKDAAAAEEEAARQAAAVTADQAAREATMRAAEQGFDDEEVEEEGGNGERDGEAGGASAGAPPEGAPAAV